MNYPRSDIPAVSRAVASRAVSTRPMVLEIDEQPTRGRSHRLQRIDDRASNRESHDSAMRIDDELRTALAKELCSLTKGWTQANAAALLRLTQPQISALRRGNYSGFSTGRLLRVITTLHYNIEIHLKPIDRPFAQPYKKPTITVVRVNRGARTSP